MRGRLLLITYEFPPLGGVGVQRVLKFAKYLPEAGWAVSVLTVKDPPGALLDPSLLAEIPADVRMHRVWSLEPTRLRQWVKRRTGDAPPLPFGRATASRRWLQSPSVVRCVQALFVPDEKRLWRGPARRRALRVIKEDGCDVIMSSGPPHTAHLVAADVCAASRRPWVVDLRDPWVDNYFFRPPTLLHARLQRRWERRVVAGADMVLTVSEPMAEQLRARHPDLPVTRFVVLPNGFDPEDMPSSHRPTRLAGSPLSVAYVGGFQGSVAPDTFLDGAALAIHSGRIPRDGLVFHHIGRGGSVAQAAASRGIGHAIRVHGFLPHKAALAAASEHDVLLLVTPPGPSGRPIVTGKLFEYLGLGLPILALVPEGPAASLVREAGAGCVVDPQDAHGVAAALASLYRGTASTELPAAPDPAVVERFDRRRQAADLAELLDALSARRPLSTPPADG